AIDRARPQDDCAGIRLVATTAKRAIASSATKWTSKNYCWRPAPCRRWSAMTTLRSSGRSPVSFPFASSTTETRFNRTGKFTIRFGSDCACPPCEGRCPMARRSDDDPLDSVLRRTGRHSAGLSIDDIAVVVGDALKNQRQQILGHVRRMIELPEMKRSDDTRFRRNLHARLTRVESAIRFLQKDRSR